MDNKTLLILADGMRPDGFLTCGHPFAETLLSQSSYTMQAKTVMPSVTLPCHMSLFHSVTPQRHNVLTNDYTPPVRPVEGLFEQINRFEGKTAIFYDWEQLRDLSRPGSLDFSYMAAGHGAEGMHKSLQMTLSEICRYIPAELPDFVFFYIGVTDEVGHKYGWMGEEYMASVREALDAMQQVISILPASYRVIITADHGGHERYHGTDQPEDMTIPVICRGPEFAAGKQLSSVSILDIAPPVTKLLGIPANRDWEGHSLL